MMRPKPLLIATLCSSCVIEPGLITETASDTGVGASDGTGSSGSFGDASSTTDAESESASSSSTPDLAPQDPVCEDGWCGYAASCGSAPFDARALALHPDGGYLAVGIRVYDEQVRLLRSTPSALTVEIPEPPVDATYLDLALDADARVSLLVGTASGYRVQLRTADTFELEWDEAHDAEVGTSLIATDIAATTGGDVIVIGRVVESLRPSSSALFVHGYSSTGELVGSWSEPAESAITPVFLVDPFAAHATIWFQSGPLSYAVRYIDGAGELVGSHEVGPDAELVGRPTRSASGWLAVAPVGDGSATYRFDEDFALVDTDFDIPEDPADGFEPVGIVAIGERSMVIARRPMAPYVVLDERFYDADGGYMASQDAGFLGGYVGEPFELAAAPDNRIYFFVRADAEDRAPAVCDFEVLVE